MSEFLEHELLKVDDRSSGQTSSIVVVGMKLMTKRWAVIFYIVLHRPINTDAPVRKDSRY